MAGGELSGDQNKEDPSNPESVEQRFKARIDELNRMGRLNKARADKSIDEMPKSIIGMDNEDLEKVIEFGQTLAATSKHLADKAWVIALLDAEIPKDQILKLRDVKDEFSRMQQTEKQHPPAQGK